MAKTAVIDELHITVRIPIRLPAPDADAVRRTLLDVVFLTRLRTAVRTVIRGFPALAPVRVSLTR